MASNNLLTNECEADFITPLLGTLDNPPSPSELKETENFHVFVSYSSYDSQWTQGLITWLESPQCGLLTCYHERDFVPGCTILENMTNSIQKSQKVLLVLSKDFVRSRWCLLEANLCLFKDCLECKPLVPVLLEPDIAIPLHLCHITYLDAKDPDFHSKLLKVLCTPNYLLKGSSVVPFQPPSVYNGKALQPLTAVNEESLHRWEAGVFSNQVPDHLRLVLQNDESYIAAITLINTVSQTKVWFRPLFLRIFLYLLGLAICLGTILMTVFCIAFYDVAGCIFFFPVLAFLIRLGFWHIDNDNYITREMQKCTGQANVTLAEEKILIGCQSRTKLHFVYVCLDGCKLMFKETFQETALAELMFQRALLHFSSRYACCLAKRHFPFDIISSHGHLEGGVCFCQYVSQQLKNEEWS